jgi:peptide/nickel transport system substrate-binding protein
MANLKRLLAGVAIAGLVVAGCGGAASTPPAETPGATATPPVEATPQPTPGAETYPRNETLYTTGKQWGPPPTWNPLDPNSAMGVVGLQYETLFLFDPLADEFVPWLAESAEWTDPKTYTIRIRPGVTWSDGQPFTAEDVAFTIGLAKIKVVGSNIWDYVTDATATDEHTVVVTFDDPAYQQWALWTYNSPILPKHIWEAKANEDILKELNTHGVGAGPYKYRTHAEDRMVWERNESWWGKGIGLGVKPRFIVDIVNTANNVALGRLMQGEFDLSNNFLPGIATLVDQGYVSTYYDEAPYMLSANTAWLVTNNKKPPLDDPEFRKAIAWAANVPDIVAKVYGNIVRPADPTGLLPTWEKYIDAAQRDELGFSYDPARARAILDAAGYQRAATGSTRPRTARRSSSPSWSPVAGPTGRPPAT